MNNHKKGCQRDRAILYAIEKHGALDTDQISVLFFEGKNRRRLAQRRMQKLHEQKKVKRNRASLSEPFYYYTGNKSGRMEHLISLNWFFVYSTKINIKQWEQLQWFEYEQDYKVLRSDALLGIKNNVTGKSLFSFVEMDIAESGNEFDKVRKYNTLYETESYTGAWWVNLAERFPKVVIVTTNSNRLKVIERKIEQENTNNLEFKVLLLNQIKGECLNENI